MLQFLFGVAFGAAGYWAWNSFGRDLLGMGNDQVESYGGFSSPSSGGSFSSPSTSPDTSPTSSMGSGSASTTGGTPSSST